MVEYYSAIKTAKQTIAQTVVTPYVPLCPVFATQNIYAIFH